MSDDALIPSSRGDFVFYQTEDGQTQIECRFENESIWLSLNLIAELFGRDKSVVSKHLKAIYGDDELTREATVAKYATVQTEGTREVRRSVEYYNLDAILAVGFRVRSPRGTQFRRWATRTLQEFLVKGFVMDDERLKNPGGWDYFDELLARIRDIRASEKRFYQKVRDLFALSSDYQIRRKETQLFFAEVQNKLLYAATRHTADELIVERADPAQPNMALTTWSGSRVRKHDILVAKNYLSEDEVDTLNRLPTGSLRSSICLDQPEKLVLGYLRFGSLRSVVRAPLCFAPPKDLFEQGLSRPVRSPFPFRFGPGLPVGFEKSPCINWTEMSPIPRVGPATLNRRSFRWLAGNHNH